MPNHPSGAKFCVRFTVKFVVIEFVLTRLTVF